MAETREAPDAQQQRLLPIVLGLGAVFVVVQVLVGHSRTPVQALGLTVGAGYLWCALVSLWGRRSAGWLRIGVVAISLAYLGIQLGTVLSSGPNAAGDGTDFEAVATWAPFGLIAPWLLLDEPMYRWGAVIVYYLELL